MGPIAYESSSYHSYSGGNFFSSYSEEVKIELINTNIVLSDGTTLAGLKWTELPNMPTPRTSFALSAIDHDIYIFGGYDANINRLTTVEVYNTERNAWRSAPDMPMRKYVRNTTFIHDNNISFYTFDTTNTNILYSYSPTEGWSTELQNETFNIPLRITTWGTTLIALPLGTTAYTDIPIMYRLSTGGWYLYNTTLSNYSKRNDFEIVQFGNILYRIGGFYLSNSTWNTWSTFEFASRFNLLNGEVMTSTPAMHYPRREGHTVVTYEDKIYVIGGKDTQRAVLNKVEIYDPSTNNWEDGDAMLSPKVDAGSVVIDDKLYVIDRDSFEVYQLP